MRRVAAVGWLLLAAVVWLTGCSTQRPPDPSRLTDIFVKDFHSDDPKGCTVADVALTHAKAQDSFRRSRVIGKRALDENYPVAPCWIEGVGAHRGQPCTWRITAAHTGTLTCGAHTAYLACPNCEDLFGTRSPA